VYWPTGDLHETEAGGHGKLIAPKKPKAVQVEVDLAILRKFKVYLGRVVQ
jgi:hypothetical protein